MIRWWSRKCILYLLPFYICIHFFNCTIGGFFASHWTAYRIWTVYRIQAQVNIIKSSSAPSLVWTFKILMGTMYCSLASPPSEPVGCVTRETLPLSFHLPLLQIERFSKADFAQNQTVRLTADIWGWTPDKWPDNSSGISYVTTGS